jgi:HlyD family secretion protein
MARRLIAIAAVLAAAGVGATLLLRQGGAGAVEPPQFRTAVVDRGAITAAVSATGSVNPVILVEVGSQLSGQIRALLADFNSRVTTGQAIARLDTDLIEARLRAAEAEVAAAEANLAVARTGAEKAAADVETARGSHAAAIANAARAEAAMADAEADARRKRELRLRGAGAEAEAERAAFAAQVARAAHQAAEAQVRQAMAQISAAEAAARTAEAQVSRAGAEVGTRAAQRAQVQVDLDRATIRAPIDGIVVSRNVNLGQTVAASLQSPTLFVIADDLSRMELWATVDEADIGRVAPGQEASFTVAAWPGRTFSGRVKDIRLAAQTVQNVVTYTVVIEAPNERGLLLPGMTATIRIVTDRREAVLRVPNAALRWRPAAGGGATPEPPPPFAAALSALPDQLGLDPAQRARFDILLAEASREVAAAPADPEERRRAATAARQRLMQRLSEVLTPEQRQRAAALRSARTRAAQEGGQPGQVHVLDAAGEPRPVPIRIGIGDGTVTEVIAGELKEGDRVVTGTARGPAPARPASGGLLPRFGF